MLKVLKSNIESRRFSLVPGETTVSLFNHNGLSGNGIYLEPRQEFRHTYDENTHIVLSVCTGSGELQVTDHDSEPFKIQVSKGDIINIPPQAQVIITNLGHELMIVSEITVTYAKAS
jgi:oxalate decarboxylase/phosphoglucose isomerase-like protein (cupin superfamily)